MLLKGPTPLLPLPLPILLRFLIPSKQTNTKSPPSQLSAVASQPAGNNADYHSLSLSLSFSPSFSPPTPPAKHTPSFPFLRLPIYTTYLYFDGKKKKKSQFAKQTNKQNAHGLDWIDTSSRWGNLVWFGYLLAYLLTYSDTIG